MKNIIIFIIMLIVSDFFIWYAHEQSHKYDEPYVAEDAYDHTHESHHQ